MLKTRRKIDVQCRALLNKDWKEVAFLERTYERPVDVSWARGLISKKQVNAFVAEYDGQIVGWCLWKKEKTSIKLVRVVVMPSVQRRGVASQLIAKLKRRLDSEVRSIHVLVRETNAEAVSFFSSKEEYGGAGFLATGVSPNSQEAFDDEKHLDDWRFEYRLD